MRVLLDLIIAIYLLPLRLSRRLSLYVKGKILQFDEHYAVTIDVARREFPECRGIIVDVGAFDGDSARYFAQAFPANRIIALEPNPEIYGRAVVKTAKYPNIEMHNLGLADRNGATDFYITTNVFSSSLLKVLPNSEIEHQNRITVNVSTLDSFLAGYNEILILKFDVQGAELIILEYGLETLKRTKLVLTEMWNSEMYKQNCMYHELDNFLRENNFQLHTLISNYNNDGMKYYDALYFNREFLAR